MLVVLGYLHDLYVHPSHQVTHGILFGAVVILSPAVLYRHTLAAIVGIVEIGIML